MSFSQTGVKYGRLRTKDEIDIYASYPKRPSVFGIRDFYATVEYYLVYNVEGLKTMLAYIQWTEPVNDVGVNTFRRMDKEVDSDE
ncbi:9987_t:CDS:2 [Funneliformis geosporum]|uniref:17194_t:CDS:1 n=1 Tax=Funneliformis geosporum TaxID=1117311 RepID=A0A9W4WKW2_9GLOM|nr:9987_t:CDS:2 [Funneliformis geosporum]CAI2169120.1 17194_t:CDS:2 [Funneliformis geosporum]